MMLNLQIFRFFITPDSQSEKKHLGRAGIEVQNEDLCSIAVPMSSCSTSNFIVTIAYFSSGLFRNTFTLRSLVLQASEPKLAPTLPLPGPTIPFSHVIKPIFRLWLTTRLEPSSSYFFIATHSTEMGADENKWNKMEQLNKVHFLFQNSIVCCCMRGSIKLRLVRVTNSNYWVTNSNYE